MAFTLINHSHFQYFHVEVLETHADVYQDYPHIEKGYIFHLTCSQSSFLNTQEKILFSTQDHWKKVISGSMEELQLKLTQFKDALLALKEESFNGFDQFAYIHLFIVKIDNAYQLVISSNSFDVSTLISLD